MKLMARLHEKFGDFWWWSLCLFVAARSGDVINAFVGLWLVPKYVPQEELGAVLPLTQVTTVIGLPISILVVTFSKFLAEYAAKGEKGKIKSMMRAFLGFTVVAVVLCYLVAGFVLPLFFERIRINSGSLGILILASAALGTMAPMFNNALQGLKKFRTMTVIGMLVAPVRLVVMLVAMPFRALSGYMLGQAAPSFLTILLSWFALRKERDASIPATPFWREDGRRIVRYTVGIAMCCGLGAIGGALQTMIIRQRLPEVESAAYYMISRFSELATYAGATLGVVMFPLVAGASAKNRESAGLLLKMTVGTLLFGGASAGFLAVFGKTIFVLVPMWSAYVQYVPDMVLLALSLTIGMAVTNFASYETAGGRFGFLLYSIPITVLQLVILVCFSGFEIFRGVVPENWLGFIRELNFVTLRNVIALQIYAASTIAFCAIVHFTFRVRKGIGI